MAITNRERVSLRVLGSSLAIGAGLFAAAHGRPPELAAALSAGTSLGENALVTALGGALTAQPNLAHNVLCDRNLIHAIGEAIKQVMGEYQKAGCSRRSKARLAAVAQGTPTRWEKLALQENPELAALSAAGVKGFVTEALTSCSAESSLSLEIWQGVVEELDSKHQLPPDVAQSVAQALHQNFTARLRSVLTDDTDIGKKAYSTLSLGLLGETRAMVGETHGIVQETYRDVKEVISGIQALQTTLDSNAHSPSEGLVSGRNEVPR